MNNHKEKRLIYSRESFEPNHIRWIIWNKEATKATEFHCSLWEKEKAIKYNLLDLYSESIEVTFENKVYLLRPCGIEDS